MPDPPRSSVAGILDELEGKARAAEDDAPYSVGVILPATTALALIETARVAQRIVAHPLPGMLNVATGIERLEAALERLAGTEEETK